MDTPSPAPGEEPRDLIALLRSQVTNGFYSNFERAFTVAVVLLVLLIFYFCEHRLTLLDLLFLPVILSGYFLNTRSTILGSVMTILVVAFFVLIKPAAFAHELPSRASYVYLLLWGSCLVLSGVLVGSMNESLRQRFRRASQTLERLNEIQGDFYQRQTDLEDANRKLEESKSRLESVLRHAMDPTVAQLIIQHKLEDEKKVISVLFADLENFSSSVEGIPPEFVIQNLNQLFNDIDPILSRFRGHLDKYVGDGFMAEFGVPYMTQQHALLAATAALRIQEHLRGRAPWRMRIGIANGLSLVGLVGSDNRKSYTAIGDIVNLAERLQHLCPPGGVCIDGNTYQQIARWCRVQPLRKPLSKEDRDLIEQTQSRLDPKRREAVEEAMVKAFLQEEEAGYVAVKGKQDQVAIYELLGFIDPLGSYCRVPREASELFHKFLRETPYPLPEENLLTLETLGGSLGHGKITAALSLALAERMGLDDQTQRNIFMAAYFHDIGKSYLPERLLGDSLPFEELSPQDQELLRGHGAAAEKALSEMNVPVNIPLLEAIAQHHERFDGSGYPEGLRGEEISLIARIIHLAGEYESLTSWRPYRDKRGITAALAELRSQMVEGKFDPKIGDLFLKMMDSSLGIA